MKIIMICVLKNQAIAGTNKTSFFISDGDRQI
jgi:hypothetical protein